MLVSVKLEDFVLFDVIRDRLDFWKLSKDEKELFISMYERYIDEDLFSQINESLCSIVNNDVVNNCIIIKKGTINNKAFNRLKWLYEQEEYYIGNYIRSEKALKGEVLGSYIEAFNGDDLFLLRY